MKGLDEELWFPLTESMATLKCIDEDQMYAQAD